MFSVICPSKLTEWSQKWPIINRREKDLKRKPRSAKWTTKSFNRNFRESKYFSRINLKSSKTRWSWWSSNRKYTRRRINESYRVLMIKWDSDWMRRIFPLKINWRHFSRKSEIFRPFTKRSKKNSKIFRSTSRSWIETTNKRNRRSRSSAIRENMRFTSNSFDRWRTNSED